jgi:fructose 1,6-bisphosphatase
MEEMEYTTMSEVMKKLAGRWFATNGHEPEPTVAVAR